MGRNAKLRKCRKADLGNIIDKNKIVFMNEFADKFVNYFIDSVNQKKINK